MKKALSPGVIAGVIILVLIVVGIFMMRGPGTGQVVEGVDSMPPEVRQAYTQPRSAPPPGQR